MGSTDDALARIRATWPSNAGYLDELAKCDRVVPFVGAGLSFPMKFPLWREFLEKLAAECGASQEVGTLLDEERYEEAASAVEREMFPDPFADRIRQTFGREPELCGAVLALPQLAAGPVVTTNFDRVLERVFANAPFERVICGAQVDAIRQALERNERFLLKIHGDAGERAGRVLTREEYDRHYAAGDPNGLRAQVARLFGRCTLLFVGCGLVQDRTMEVLTEMQGRASGAAHFAIVEKPEDETAFHAKRKALAARGIRPIWYPHGEHHLIEPLLRWIAPAPDLALETPAQRAHPVRGEVDLLIPYQRITGFVGRAAEMESLKAWLGSDAPVSVRVITGGGGSGKTRLAVELLLSLGAEWHGGFLTAAEMERFARLHNLAAWARHKPVLAVVDYAAESAGPLRQWLTQLAAAQDGGAKLRLLLLEREASLEAGWLGSLLPAGHEASAVRAWFDPPEPVRLPAVTEAADRRAVLQAAIEKAAAFRKVTPPAVPADPLFDRRLGEPLWGDPLTLMMAGVTALDTNLVEALALGRADLALGLARRECERVARCAPESPAGLMEHMAAYVTVCGGLSRAELRQAVRSESEAIGRTHPSGWGVLADCVEKALGGRAVAPDVIGEALLLTVWGKDEGSEAVLRAARMRGEQAAASVVRTVQDFGTGESPRPEPLAWFDALFAAARTDLGLLLQLESALPASTLALRERAAEVDLLLVPVLREKGEIAALARVLNNLGHRLREVGRREQALQAGQEAVELYRGLAEQSPDAFAGSLDNLGNWLSDLGRHEEALEATREAADLYRQQATQRHDAFFLGLATSLNNLGNRFGALRRFEEALHAAQEAVTLYRQLEEQRPAAFLPDLAGSLNNLANWLSALGRRDEALRAAQEAVDLYRQTVAQRPDAFLPDLAGSLNNLGNRLLGLGRRDEALCAAQEAVQIRRQLAAQRPDAFLPDLAMSLGVKAKILRGGDDSAAAVSFREGIGCLKPLFLRLPEAFRPLMGTLLVGYINACNAARTELDLALLSDILPILRPDQADATGA